MNQQISLTNLVELWIKDHPRFKDHYHMEGNEVAGIKLDWLRCECKKKGEIPPIPEHEMIIHENHLILCRYKKGWHETIVAPHDLELFAKLEFFLDHSHELLSY